MARKGGVVLAPAGEAVANHHGWQGDRVVQLAGWVIWVVDDPQIDAVLGGRARDVHIQQREVLVGGGLLAPAQQAALEGFKFRAENAGHVAGARETAIPVPLAPVRLALCADVQILDGERRHGLNGTIGSERRSRVAAEWVHLKWVGHGGRQRRRRHMRGA